jgi:Glycosyl transferase family 11
MISCMLMGGLGNQLFQIFATIAYALENRKPFGFVYTKHLGGTPATIKRPTYWDSFLFSLKNFTHENLGQNPILREKGFTFGPLPSPEHTDTMLLGYFQSYKYFDQNFQAICRLIKLDKIKMQIKQKYPHNFDSSISMHFRLGDYKKLSEFHPVLSQDYYEAALTHVTKNTKLTHVLYFCEEQDNEDVSQTITFLKDNFPNVTFEKVDDTIPDWEQMVMMSCCKCNIIANSTFSWWAAYFNHYNNKIVCYPGTWFGPKNQHLDTRDMFPEEWIAFYPLEKE